MQAKNPLENLTQKEKTQWNTSWEKLLEAEVSTYPIVPQNLFVIRNNKMMSME
jgi:hypothetical protein